MNRDIGAQFKNLFSKKHKAGKLGGEVFRPDRDWEIIIGSFLLINLALIGWSAYVFLSNAAASDPTEVAVSALPSVSDRQKVANIIAQYEEKKRAENMLVGSVLQISDPSL